MTTSADTTSTTGAPNQLMAAPADLGSYAKQYVAKVRGGDVGALPALLGIIVLSVVFWLTSPVFLTNRNFANLITQGAPIVVIAMGLIFVLLLGEIDLAAGYTSGVAAATLAILLSPAHNLPLWIAFIAAIAAGTAIGVFQGLLVAKLRIPSFVVTLAGFLAWQGVVLAIVGDGGTIVISNKLIVGIENNNMPVVWGWVLLVVLVAGYGGLSTLRVVRRRAAGLVVEPLGIALIRTALIALIGAGAVYELSQDRSLFAGTKLIGVPWVVPLVAVLLGGLTFLLGRTAYGRHLYATGGNTEASRRAGIRVDRVRISGFVICSTLAAVGGIIAASRLSSVDPQAGGNNTLLFAVGAAVIGGTSLFGGRGRMRDALLGGAVIAIIANGMSLLGWSSARQFIATGVVLLIAASVDATSRKSASAPRL
jgi:D-xylose transport system permease protein